jgi:hypothetical protein
MCACHGPKQEGIQSVVTAIPQHSSVGANSLTRANPGYKYNPGRYKYVQVHLYSSRGLGRRADPGRL